jgi:hypothetical protein
VSWLASVTKPEERGLPGKQDTSIIMKVQRKKAGAAPDLCLSARDFEHS